MILMNIIDDNAAFGNRAVIHQSGEKATASHDGAFKGWDLASAAPDFPQIALPDKTFLMNHWYDISISVGFIVESF